MEKSYFYFLFMSCFLADAINAAPASFSPPSCLLVSDFGEMVVSEIAEEDDLSMEDQDFGENAVSEYAEISDEESVLAMDYGFPELEFDPEDVVLPNPDPVDYYVAQPTLAQPAPPTCTPLASAFSLPLYQMFL